MKRVEIKLTLDCRDDVPAHVIDWMAENLAEHAGHEFVGDYEPEWGEGYEGPPVEGAIVVSHASGWALRPYLEYLDSPEWKAVCAAARRRAHFRCEREQPGEARHEGPLELRLRDYRTIGEERPEDLELVCPSCWRAEKLAKRKAAQKQKAAEARQKKRMEAALVGA